MIQKSKFAFLPVFIALFLTISAIGLLYLTISSPRTGILLPIFFLLFVIYFWLTEFRTRAHKIKITDDEIIKKEYFGFGKQKSYNIKDLEGFHISSQPGKYGAYEYIFIIKEGKRIASISKFYHRNYIKLKYSIEQKVNFLGIKEYRFENEYKEMFK